MAFCACHSKKFSIPFCGYFRNLPRNLGVFRELAWWRGSIQCLHDVCKHIFRVNLRGFLDPVEKALLFTRHPLQRRADFPRRPERIEQLTDGELERLEIKWI